MTRLLLSLLLLAPAAHAADLREETECFAFGKIMKALDKLESVDPEYRDVVDTRPVARIARTEDDVPPPERLFFRHGDTEHDIAFPEAGEIPELLEVGYKLGKKSEVCLTDPHFAGTPKDKQGRMVSIGMLPEYTALDGSHTLAELREGLTDGRVFYKKLAPAIVSFMVPDLTHVAVSHPLDDKHNLPTVEAFRGAESLGEVEMEPFTVSQLLDLETLEAMGADRIEVRGDYRLFPMPDAETVRKYMK